MEKALLVSHVIISVLLSLAILVQGKDEGFSTAGGGSFKGTRRGPELVLFRATVVLAALFLANALLFIFV